MGLFRKQAPAFSGEHLPETLPATCLGEKCPNYLDAACNATEMEWLSAGGPTENRDKSKPPLKDEATYIIYGQRCLAAARSQLVAQRVEIYQPDKVNMMQLMALTGRYGDMPIEVVNLSDSGGSARIETIASSE